MRFRFITENTMPTEDHGDEGKGAREGIKCFQDSRFNKFIVTNTYVKTAPDNTTKIHSYCK